MRILLNFVPLKKGGGVQVGLDFLEQLRRQGGRHDWYLVSSDGTPFSDVEETDCLHPVKTVSQNSALRARFEYFEAGRIENEIRPHVTYTQFGPQWPNMQSPQVVGCAYSNLFYPEVDFWGKLPLFERTKRKLIDRFRLHRLRQANVVIFETPELGRRATEVLHTGQTIRVVEPCPSSMIRRRDCPVSQNTVPLADDNRFKVLMLSGYHPNKTIELLPRTAALLKENGRASRVMFVLTLPTEDSGTRKILRDAHLRGVTDMFLNLGPVKQVECGDLYQRCDAVILPSRLESFSNNIVEAWESEKPLLISDLDWARDICGDAAVYFAYSDEHEACRRLIEIMDSPHLVADLVSRGVRRLGLLSTSEKRFAQYLKIIEDAAA